MGDLLRSGEMSLSLVVWSLYIGILIAGCMIVYDKRYLGEFVRSLLENEAFSRERAMTLEELGLDRRFLLRRAINKGIAFKSLVYEKDDEVEIAGGSARPVFRKKAIDFTSSSFYIPYELRIRAEMKYEKKGTHVVLVAISAVFFFVLALLLTANEDRITDFIKAVFG